MNHHRQVPVYLIEIGVLPEDFEDIQPDPSGKVTKNDTGRNWAGSTSRPASLLPPTLPPPLCPRLCCGVPLLRMKAAARLALPSILTSSLRAPVLPLENPLLYTYHPCTVPLPTRCLCRDF